MTIRFSEPITADNFTMHLQTSEVGAPVPPRSLCMDGGTFRGTTYAVYDTDPRRVTCPACLEWMHA